MRMLGGSLMRRAMRDVGLGQHSALLPVHDIWLGGTGADGRGFPRLGITSASGGVASGYLAVGPDDAGGVTILDKPAGYPAGFRGLPIVGSAPSWAGVANPRWYGTLPTAATLNAYSLPTPGSNGWTLASATDGGAVAGPGGALASARRINFSGAAQQIYRTLSAGAKSSTYPCIVIKGAAGNKINWYFGGGASLIEGQITLTGGWQVYQPAAPLAGNSDGLYLSINTIVATLAGATAVQSVDIALAQVSDGPFPLLATTGSNLTRLAEVVALPVTARPARTIVLDLNLSDGLPTTKRTLLGNGSAKLSLNATGTIELTDGSTTVTSTAALTAATGQKCGMAMSGSAALLKIGATVESKSAVDWSAITSLYLGASSTSDQGIIPIDRLRVYDRTQAAAELGNV